MRDVIRAGLHQLYWSLPPTSSSGRIHQGSHTVLKIVPYESSFDQEIRDAKLAADLGIGPRIVDSGTSGSYGYIEFEKLDGTLEAFLNERMNVLYEEGGGVHTPQARTWFDNLARDLRTMFDKMKEHNFLHMDLHTDNIMYKEQPNGTVRWYLIDYGMAVQHPRFPLQFVDPSNTVVHTSPDLQDAWHFSTRWLRQKLNELLYDDTNAATPLRNVLSQTVPPVRQPDLS